MSEPHFTDRELDVMDVLWRLQSATAAEVQKHLPDELAYTTVLTLLRILEEKGYARHEVEGRTYRFYPLVQREEAGRSALQRLLTRIFVGSPESLLTQLVANRGLTAEDLRRMRRLLDKRIEEEEG